jgi:hypothetical protein
VDLPTKVEYARRVIDSILTHDDAPPAERSAAAEELCRHIDAGLSRAAARAEGRGRDAGEGGG